MSITNLTYGVYPAPGHYDSGSLVSPISTHASAAEALAAAERETRRFLARRTVDRASTALEGIGYRLLAVEIDLEQRHARVEVRRHDGYTLTLDVRAGSGTITRERVRFETIAVGRRGDRFLTDRMRMEFCGRSYVTGGARAALRAFADMIGDNAPAGRLAARNAVRLLLDGESVTP